ncbi:MAG: hypothetical protein R3D71_01515 [Rickettsiales bacterium]
MGNIIMKVEGNDGQIELMSDRVIINRAGVFNIVKFGLNAKREIPVGAISEVAYKKPSLLGMGEIEFVVSGRNNSRDKKQVNHNLVKFGNKKKEEFEALKEKVFDLINEQRVSK